MSSLQSKHIYFLYSYHSYKYSRSRTFHEIYKYSIINLAFGMKRKEIRIADSKLSDYIKKLKIKFENADNDPPIHI